MKLFELTPKFVRKSVDQNLPFDDEHLERGHKIRLQGEPWRGPHEGRVLTLMLHGLKPAALLDDSDINKFRPYVEQGKFAIGEFDINWHGSLIKQYVVTQLGQEWRIKRIAKLFADRPDYDSINLWHARLGMLLGYSNEDIKKFLTDR